MILNFETNLQILTVDIGDAVSMSHVFSSEDEQFERQQWRRGLLYLLVRRYAGDEEEGDS